MSTIASPRPSLTLSSRRDSISTDNTTRSVSTSRPPAPLQPSGVRRNRAALRNYYGLREATSASTPGTGDQTPATPLEPAEKDSELDRAGFDPERYVTQLLATEGLEGILRIEAGLVSEVRTLDGEKKALVYDNYSRLIAATETIRKMRTNMDPLSPTTSTLTPTITQIAETATALSDSLRRKHGDLAAQGGDTIAAAAAAKREAQKSRVRWVLAGPQRLKELVANGRKEDADAEWSQIRVLLDKWAGTDGVDRVRAQCLAALSGEGS